MYFTILGLRMISFNMFYHVHVFVRNGTPYATNAHTNIKNSLIKLSISQNEVGIYFLP